MATLGALRTELRERKLVEASTDYYTDLTLLGIIEDSSREIAAAFRFPKITATISAGSAGSITLTKPSRLIDVESLAMGGLTVKRTTYPHVKFLQQLVASDWTRGYHFDPSAGGGFIAIGPATVGTPSYDLEYVADAYAAEPVTTSTDAWDGLFEEFHELIVLRGAMHAYEMGFEMDKAQYWFARYSQVLQEFAQFMGLERPPVEVQQRATA